ncbi:GtrA family protein [Amycolatopsis nigrescens]|uniref:GtrA family protein n=1 Tax=Amycolatopsis nigrescens TaxID=381445 RepID=UPI0003636832|nr:GtrA family protein [Amycolatopsis nigrescens]
MPVTDKMLRLLPRRLKALLITHHELLRFAVVGGLAFVVTNVVGYALKLTVLSRQPLTALGIAVLVATIFSYVLSREWSFRTRGGRQRRHEAALFFLISAIAVGLNLVPLAISRYVLQLHVPEVGLLTQEIADYVSSFILGTLLGTVFRWWGFRKWVFPQADVRTPRGRRRAGTDALPEDRAA